jgi:hypothetical protein
MSETVRNLFLKVRTLLDEYTDDGTLIPEADVIDMQSKAVLLADMAQKELYKIGKLYNTFEYLHDPPPNLLGLLSNFDIVNSTGTLDYYPDENGVIGAKAYYFEATNNVGTVKIQERQSGIWTDLITITLDSNTNTWKGYKGTITTQDSTNPVRMVFNGTNHYRHVNRCLYSYPFADGDVQAYRPWFKVQMPDNFRSIDQIIEEYPQRQYQESRNYKWEGFKSLYVNYYFKGNIRIVYKPVPTTITCIDDTLEIDDITAQAIVYYIAARLAPFENKELTNFFESKYMELKIESANERPMNEEVIIDVYANRW